MTRLTGADGSGPALAEDGRLLRLAAALSFTAALSGADELHHRDLPAATALTLALKGVGGAQPVSPQEIRDRVRARFPALPPLPDRPRLDELLGAAGLGLVYDDAERAFRSPTRAADTTGLAPRLATRIVAAGTPLVAGGRVGHRLAESAASRSFLALGTEAPRVDRAIEVLVRRYDAHVLDLTAVLVGAIRGAAMERGVPWEAVRAADAAAAGSRAAEGLAELVRLALAAIDREIESASVAAPEATRPVLLIEASPLARYGHLATLSRWADLASRRSQAIWLLVPQLLGNQGAVVDGRPLPLAAPGQFLRLDVEWLDNERTAISTEGVRP